jgi:hypothetical protein
MGRRAWEVRDNVVGGGGTGLGPCGEKKKNMVGQVH